MLSRLRLSSKMVLAAAPLVAVLIGLLTLTVGTNVEQITEADRTGSLGSTWQPLVAAIEAVDGEQDAIKSGDTAAIDTARATTDEAFVALTNAVANIPDSGALRVTVADAGSSLSRSRGSQNSGDFASPIVSSEYSITQETLVNLGDLLAAEATDTELGRKLQAVAALTRAAYNTDELLEMIDITITTGDDINVDRAELLGRNALFALERFEASAPEEWIDIYERRNLPATTEASIAELEWLLSQGPQITPAIAAQFDMQRFSAPIVSETGLRNLLAERVTDDANELSSSIAQSTFIRIGYVTAAILVALLLSYLTARSITRRMGRVSDRAREVAQDQLPRLVESLRDPSGTTPLPEVTPIEGVGRDEIGELAESFTAVQSTLVDVAAEQMDVLWRGVSDIFVTLARRNRSLVDRQLALLDELEASVEDPELLADYYKLDHIATRMRRSAESLLVLANTDTQRRRSGPVEVDDVVRAAMSEVEDYRRIDVLALESLQIKGPLVADTSHLLAELLDNAASFSPPDSRVAVAGHFTGAGYLITISDRGVGIPEERLVELNQLLGHPPVIGLSVEPTLGLSVVSLLAAKHNIKVSLVRAAPGVSVNIVLPASMYEHTSDVDAGPAFDEVFDDVVHGGSVGMPDPKPIPDEDAARATTTALDAIASVKRDETPPAPVAPVEPAAPVAREEAAPLTDAGLPQRRPAPIEPDPPQPVADFRPAPTTDEIPIAPVERPIMPAPAPTDLPLPDLAPPPAATPAPAPGPAPLPTRSPSTDGLPTRRPGAAKPVEEDRLAAVAPTIDPNSISLPMQDPVTNAPTTDAGLPRREAGVNGPTTMEERPVTSTGHDPEALRSTLSAFHTSTQLGRLDGADTPEMPSEGEN